MKLQWNLSSRSIIVFIMIFGYLLLHTSNILAFADDVSKDSSDNTVIRSDSVLGATADVERQTTKLMEKFNNDDPTKVIMLLTAHEIAEKIGIPALEYLLAGLTNDNDNIRAGSILAISFILPSHNKKGVSYELSSEKERPLLNKLYDIVNNRSFKDPNADIRASALGILLKLQGAKAKDKFEHALLDPERYIRGVAFRILMDLGYKDYDYLKVVEQLNPQTVNDYLKLLSENNSSFAFTVANRLVGYGTEAIPGLLEIANDDKSPARAMAIDVIARISAPVAVTLLTDNLIKASQGADIKEEFQLYCIDELAKIGTTEAINGIKCALYSKHSTVKLRAVNILKDNKQQYLFALQSMLYDSDLLIRFEAAVLLAENGYKPAVSALIDLLGNRGLYSFANSALKKVTGVDVGGKPKDWQRWWKENKDKFEFPLINDKTPNDKTPIKQVDYETSYSWKKVYDPSGKLIEEKACNTDGTFSHKWLYKYNESGNMIEKSKCLPDGTLEQRIVLKYNLLGKVEEEILLGRNDKFIYKETFFYDANGKKVTMEKRNSEDKLLLKATYEYKANGNLYREIDSYSDGSKKIYEY